MRQQSVVLVQGSNCSGPGAGGEMSVRYHSSLGILTEDRFAANPLVLEVMELDTSGKFWCGCEKESGVEKRGENPYAWSSHSGGCLRKVSQGIEK